MIKVAALLVGSRRQGVGEGVEAAWVVVVLPFALPQAPGNIDAMSCEWGVENKSQTQDQIWLFLRSCNIGPNLCLSAAVAFCLLWSATASYA